MEDDIKALTELVQEIAEKYDGMYINIFHTRGYDSSFATWEPSDGTLKSISSKE